MLLVVLLGVCAMPAMAQMATVKGVCKDQEGKPITDGVVEWINLDNGRKIDLKTNKSGEYFSVGIPPGNYNVTLSRDGKVIDLFNNIVLEAGEVRQSISI